MIIMDTAYPSQITSLLVEIGKGKSSHVNKLLPLVYDEFRGIANRYLKKETAEHTFQPTDLVHEAYLKLVDQKKVNWKGRSHFYAIGAMTMRRILVDYARAKKSKKRGHDWERISLHDGLPLSTHNDADILALDEALKQLEDLDKVQARIVEMRFFGGLKNKEIAQVINKSERTVKNEWRMARLFLLDALLEKDS